MATPMHFLDVARMLRAVAIDSLSLPFSMRRKQSGYELRLSLTTIKSTLPSHRLPVSSCWCQSHLSGSCIYSSCETRPFSRLSSPHQTKLKLMIYLLAMFGEKRLVKRVKSDMIETFMLPTLPTLNSVPNQLRALDGLHGIGLVVLLVSMSHILATSTVQYV